MPLPATKSALIAWADVASTCVGEPAVALERDHQRREVRHVEHDVDVGRPHLLDGGVERLVLGGGVVAEVVDGDRLGDVDAGVFEHRHDDALGHR